MTRFLLVVTFIITILWAYTWFSFVYLSSWPDLLFYFLTTLWLASYLFQIWRWMRFENADSKRLLSWIGYLSFGFISQGLAVALVKDFFLGLLSFHSEFIPLPIYHQAGFAILMILNCLGVLIALSGPILVSVQIKTPKWKSNQKIKVVQISDLHVGPIIKYKYVTKVVEDILELKPDLIAITGDLGDGQAKLLKADLEPLRQLSEKHPTYFVPGNHEVYWNLDSWLQAAKNLGFRVLFNKGQVHLSQPPLWIGGVPDIATQNLSRPNEILSASNPQLTISADSSFYQVLLAHQPKSYLAAEQAGFDLMLCGHTHNGQYFPFNFFVGFFNPYVKGLNQFKNMLIYVNSGTGFWGPPLRLGTRSEITVIEISGSHL